MRLSGEGRTWAHRFAWAAGLTFTVAAIAMIATRKRRPTAVPSLAEQTARVRALYDREARQYDTFIRIPERLLFGEGRAWAASQARGDVLEIAAGTGRNLPYYSPGVRITAQDLSPAMLEIARERARTLARDVNLQVGDAQNLAFAAARFDSVVCTLGLCTIPDDRLAIVEAHRVLRSGGRLILIEHVRSTKTAVRLLQRLFEPLANRYAGDHLLRDPMDHLPALGFSVQFCTRSRAGIVEHLIAQKG